MVISQEVINRMRITERTNTFPKGNGEIIGIGQD